MLATMWFANLPDEIIINVVENLEEHHIAVLLRVNKSLYASLADYLIQHNVRHHSGRALMWAIKGEHRDLAHKLVQYGANVNFHYSKLHYATLLHLAAFASNLTQVKLLLELEADPQQIDLLGQTAVCWAYKNGDEEAVRLMTSNVVNLPAFIVDQSQRLTPLHMACASGLVTLINEYIDMGMDVSAKDYGGRSPLDYIKVFLARPSRMTHTLDRNRIPQAIKVLVMLGEDVAAAHDQVRHFISWSERFRHDREIE